MGIIKGPFGSSTRLVGTQEKLVFLADFGRKCPDGTQNRCFWEVRQRFVGSDWGKAQGCDPVGVVEGPCGYPAV